MIQVQGRDEEEEGERLPTVESWADRVRLKPKPKRRGAEEARAEMEAMASRKRRRVGDLPVITGGDAAEHEAAGGDDGERLEVAAGGEGGRPEQKQKAAPLPVRGSKAKSNNRKTSSRGKRTLVDPRQQKINSFFQVKDAEETGKLKSSDRLNLDADNAGLGGAAAGVGFESDVGPSQESEKRNCQKNN